MNLFSFPHYFMCQACAFCMGAVWPKEPFASTVCMGTCPYCDFEEQTLIPWVDFDWPDLDEPTQKGAKFGRD